MFKSLQRSSTWLWTEAILSRSFRWSWCLLLHVLAWICWICLMLSYQFCNIIQYSQYSIFLFWCGPKSRKHMTRSPKASPSPRVELALELANHTKRFSDEAEDSSEARGTWDPTGYCYWLISITQMIRGPLQFPSSAEEKIKTAENKFFWPFWSGVYCLRCMHFLCEPTCTGNKAWLHFGRRGSEGGGGGPL